MGYDAPNAQKNAIVSSFFSRRNKFTRNLTQRQLAILDQLPSVHTLTKKPSTMTSPTAKDSMMIIDYQNHSSLSRAAAAVPPNAHGKQAFRDITNSGITNSDIQVDADSGYIKVTSTSPSRARNGGNPTTTDQVEKITEKQRNPTRGGRGGGGRGGRDGCGPNTNNRFLVLESIEDDEDEDQENYEEKEEEVVETDAMMTEAATKGKKRNAPTHPDEEEGTLLVLAPEPEVELLPAILAATPEVLAVVPAIIAGPIKKTIPPATKVHNSISVEVGRPRGIQGYNHSYIKKSILEGILSSIQTVHPQAWIEAYDATIQEEGLYSVEDIPASELELDTYMEDPRVEHGRFKFRLQIVTDKEFYLLKANGTFMGWCSSENVHFTYSELKTTRPVYLGFFREPLVGYNKLSAFKDRIGIQIGDIDNLPKYQLQIDKLHQTRYDTRSKQSCSTFKVYCDEEDADKLQEIFRTTHWADHNADYFIPMKEFISLAINQQITIINEMNAYSQAYRYALLDGFRNNNPPMQLSPSRSNMDWEQEADATHSSIPLNPEQAKLTVSKYISTVKDSIGNPLFIKVSRPTAGIIEVTFEYHRTAEIQDLAKVINGELSRRMTPLSQQLCFLHPERALKSARDNPVWQPYQLATRIAITPTTDIARNTNGPRKRRPTPALYATVDQDPKTAQPKWSQVAAPKASVTALSVQGNVQNRYNQGSQRKTNSEESKIQQQIKDLKSELQKTIENIKINQDNQIQATNDNFIKLQSETTMAIESINTIASDHNRILKEVISNHTALDQQLNQKMDFMNNNIQGTIHISIKAAMQDVKMDQDDKFAILSATMNTVKTDQDDKFAMILQAMNNNNLATQSRVSDSDSMAVDEPSHQHQNTNPSTISPNVPSRSLHKGLAADVR